MFSSSTLVASAHRALSASSTSQGPSSTWKLWTCIVNFRCEKTHGTLPRSLRCLILAWPLSPMGCKSPATNCRATRLLHAVEPPAESGSTWLGSSHSPARSPTGMAGAIVSWCSSRSQWPTHPFLDVSGSDSSRRWCASRHRRQSLPREQPSSKP